MIVSRFAALIAAATLLFSSPALAASKSFEDALQSSSELYEQGRFQEVIPLAKKALAIAERQIGTDDAAFASLLENLATVYEAELQYDKAHPLYQRALDIRVKVYGSNPPEVVNSLLNLTLIYDALGDYGSAGQMDVRATEIIEANNREQPQQG